MKKEDIYIRVDHVSIDWFVKRLERIKENIGGVSIIGECNVLQYNKRLDLWFVGSEPVNVKVLNGRFGGPTKPDDLYELLKQTKVQPTTELYVKDRNGNFQPVTVLEGHTAVKFSNGVVGSVANEDLFTIKPFKP